MVHSLRIASAALLAMGLALPAAPAEERTPTWYAQALTRGEGGLNVTHFWSKGPWLRSETVVAGHKVVTIVRGEWYYAFDATLGRGLGIRRDPAAVAKDKLGRRPFGNEYALLVKQGAEKVREETVMGRPTGVFRVTDDYGRREIWVTLDEKRIPLRAEMFERHTRIRRYTDYVNWQSGLPLPDSFFEPDERIELDRIELEAYLKRTVHEGPVGPIPVLFANLLYAPKDG